MDVNVSLAIQAYAEKGNKYHSETTSVNGNTSAGYGDYYDWYQTYYGNIEDEITTGCTLYVITIILCVLGLLANSLSVFAIIRGYRKLTTHLKLVINLCLTDTLIIVPSFASAIVGLLDYVNVCFNLTTRLVTDLALFLTLLNLLGIAIDHSLAIMKPFLYRKEMTNFRGMCAVFVIWLLGALAVGIEIFHGLIGRKENEPFCEAIAYDGMSSEVGICVFIFLCLFVILAVYSTIYLTVIRGRSSKRKNSQERDGSRSTKTFITTSLFVLTFVVFWTPIGIFNVFMHFKSEQYLLNHLKSIVKIGQILYVILLLNTIADPIIYALRLRQVRKQYLKRDSRGLSRQYTRTRRSTS